MINFIIALNCVTPMFLTLCVGILLRASKIVPEEAFHHLSQISFHAFLPCLMFSNLYSADLSGTDHATIFRLSAGLGGGVVPAVYRRVQ